MNRASVLACPAGVCNREGTSRFPWASPLFIGSEKSRYGVARPLSRLAFCGFFFASFFRSAATANRRVSRLAQQPEGLGLDAIKPICSILRKMRRKQRKQRDRCRPSGEMTAPRPGRLGRAAARNAGRVAKPPYRQERQAIRKAPGGRGRTVRPTNMLSRLAQTETLFQLNSPEA